MKWLTILSNFAGLFNRLLDKWEQYDKERKRLRREERRASVADDPDSAFADLFGEPDRVSDAAKQSAKPLRPDTAKAPVEPDG
jgi:hypothetical protein